MKNSEKKIKKILITAYDLEQIEHRGIAVFSKNLIMALHQMGCEVWLLTSAPYDSRGSSDSVIAHLSVPAGVQDRISRIREIPGVDFFKKFLPRKLKHYIRHLLLGGKGDPTKIHFKSTTEVMLPAHKWMDRLAYLNFIRGFINIPNIFIGSVAQIEGGNSSISVTKVNLKKYDFDGIISTCPLPLQFHLDGWQIQTVHDLIPIEIPSQHSWNDPKIFSQRIEAACRFSDLVIAVSATTANRMQSLGFKPAKVKVLYQPKSFSNSKNNLNSSVSLVRQPYVISIGSVEPRKNILTAVRAFLSSDLPARGYCYIVIGDIKGGVDAEKLRILSDFNKSIVLTGYVDDLRRDELMLGSECLIFPSIIEGFGIPLVDAIQLGKKIICSDIPVFREVAGERAVFVDPRYVDGWVHAFNSIEEIEGAVPNPNYDFDGFQTNLAALLDGL